jgi:hypothetical protein
MRFARAPDAIGSNGGVRMNPTALLIDLAEDCRLAGDRAAFWILVSAASHLAGFRLCDGEGSTAEMYFWSREEAACMCWLCRGLAWHGVEA